MKLKMGRRTFPVSSYAEASAIWCKHRDDNDLGSSNSPRTILVIEDDGTKRRVSYNGRIWPTAEYQPGAVSIFDPA